MKVVINGCYGGFSLSPEAELRLYELGCTEIATHVDEYWPPEKRAEDQMRYPTLGYHANLEKWRAYKAGPANGAHSIFLTAFTPDEQYVLNARDIKRDDPRLLQVIEELGEAANGRCAALRVVEIPDGVEWEIEEYDGTEWVAEKHRTWS